MVQSHLPPFQNLGNFVHPTFACLLEETLKAGGAFYLVSMPGEVEDPNQRVNVDSLIIEKDNSENPTMTMF